MAVYINRKGGGYTETVDEFDTRKEAKVIISEYRLSDSSGDYWLSSRACKDWRESKQPKVSEGVAA